MDYRIETSQKVKIQNVVETNYDTCKNVQLYMYTYDIKKITCPLPKKQDYIAIQVCRKKQDNRKSSQNSTDLYTITCTSGLDKPF